MDTDTMSFKCFCGRPLNEWEVINYPQHNGVVCCFKNCITEYVAQSTACPVEPEYG